MVRKKLESAEMKIRVIFRDKTAGLVQPSELNQLIEEEKIAAFFRAEGWVDVEKGPVRGEGGEYQGPERRSESIPPTDFFG